MSSLTYREGLNGRRLSELGTAVTPSAARFDQDELTPSHCLPQAPDQPHSAFNSGHQSRNLRPAIWAQMVGSHCRNFEPRIQSHSFTLWARSMSLAGISWPIALAEFKREVGRLPERTLASSLSRKDTGVSGRLRLRLYRRKFPDWADLRHARCRPAHARRAKGRDRPAGSCRAHRA
jgi:hypothetical protein